MSKRQELRDKRRRDGRNRQVFTLGGIALVAIVIVVLIIVTNLPKPVGDITMPVLKDRPQANGNSAGDPNAPIKIVEYSDFQCPYCATYWQNTEGQIMDQYVQTGKVYYTSRSMGNFVSDNINRGSGTNNRESEDAAMAAYCAGDQGKYWQYQDVLFANQGAENKGFLARNRLEAFAEKLSLDMNTFRSCLSSGKHLARVTQDNTDGSKAITSAPNYDGSGVGTPAFLVNGKLISGAQSFTAFKNEIEAQLAGKK